MRNIAVKLSLIATVVLGLSAGGIARDGANTSATGPSFKYLGPLAMGPDGVVFAADSQEVSVSALELKSALKGGTPGTEAVAGIDRKIAALLGTDAAGIEITDALVYTPTRNTLISVMRGHGAAATPALVKVDGSGTLTVVPLATVHYSKVMMPNPPPKVTEVTIGASTFSVPNYPDRPKDDSIIGKILGTQTITHMAYDNGRLFVTGLSNEEFASKLRSIAYPFSTVDRGTGVEIWHGSHGQFETRSPIYSFVPYTVKGERYIIASYTCTPLVKIPESSIKPGADVRGVTIGEFGTGSRPLDMIVYTKGGRDYLLMATNMRGVLKAPTDGFADTPAITRQVQVEDRIGVVPETIPSLKGVEQLDKLDDTRAVLLTRTAGALDLQVITLP
ncbi:MAG TPA: hypothetical protein VGY48_19305 [Vicinamibacterales bacterium]|nr:hypothetical protein [Vicinamibacterales bacterium]